MAQPVLAQKIVCAAMHLGGRRYAGNGEMVGVDDEVVYALADYLGISVVTPNVHDKLWNLLGAIEDGALTLTALVPKNADGYVVHETSINNIFEVKS